MSKVSLKKQKKKHVATFPLVNIDSAGIDISDKEMMVAVPPDRDGEFVRCTLQDDFIIPYPKFGTN